MPTLYSNKRYFRDDGNTWYGRWGMNRNNACLGNGFGIGYDKGFYEDPVEEGCSNGERVIKLVQIANVTDPNFDNNIKELGEPN
ncbi:hypothetical protein [Mesorhizobium sp. M1163]|uniref:hypothetical protein n=1 Tax=Mesorhizobium sp. M1163 TaxID=2957065 RepID=UPI003338D7F5